MQLKPMITHIQSSDDVIPAVTPETYDLIGPSNLQVSSKSWFCENASPPDFCGGMYHSDTTASQADPLIVASTYQLF